MPAAHSVSDTEVDALRRRAAELTALYSSARELAGVRDTDAVLERLVARAHEMLAADLTYLSEFDSATGELHVRATYGTVSAEFRELVVPRGRGLVSVIVETQMPQAVTRYADYAAERHEPVVDAAVAAEGIVSLLGVPLRSDGVVIGVLFVAMRQERDFAPDQIALLSALADHAAVVLQTAANLRELRRSEEEARTALAQLSEHLAERERAHTVHQRLVGAVLEGGGFAPVAETLASTLDRAVWVVDERGDDRSVAGDVTDLRAAWSSRAFGVAVEESRASGHAVPVDLTGGQAVVAALAAGSRGFGAVVIGPGSFELGAVDLRTIERAAQVGALLALSDEAVVEAAHRQQADLVADLLVGGPERRGDVTARLRRLGLEPDAFATLTVLLVPGDRRADATRLLSRTVGAEGLVGEVAGLLVVLGTAAGPPSAVLHEHTARTLAAPVLAVSGPPGPSPLPDRFDVARRSARVLAALGVADAVATSDDLLPYAAVLDADQRALSAFLDGTIGAVRSYDRERGTELLATLRAFVRSGGSPTRTARALTFHPNTILQRLERLDRVLGAGWRDDEQFFRISLAVRLDELRERVSPATATVW